MVFAVTGGNQDDAYEISNSARFVDDASGYLSFTPSSASNRRTYTFSTWVKRGRILEQQNIFGTAAEGDVIYFDAGDRIRFFHNGSASSYLGTNRMFRDVSAWYHIVLAVDTTQSTDTDRVKLYVNGSQYTWDASTTYPTQNLEGDINNNQAHYVGGGHHGQGNLDCYLADTILVDGSALTPTSFGRTNTNGVWIPKDYGGSCGTNGFKLEYKQTGTSANSSGIGADTSGNDNHFSVNNMGATEITTDTPTNNFAVMNILTAGADEPEFRHGNLQQYAHGTSNNASTAATIMPDKGKWYVELELESPSPGDYPFFGITDQRNLNQQNANGTKMAAGFEIDGATNNQSNTFLGTITNTNTGWPTFADGDIVMFALDLDNKKLWLGRNGTWINSGDPAGNSNEQLSWTLTTNVSVCMFGYDGGGGGGAQSKWNFGNPPFSISSSNADANGYGNFEYAVPSGYYALCTKNLAEYG